MQSCLPTRFVLAIGIALTIGGCSKSPDQLHQIALDAEKTAREARANKDPKKAHRAATEAADAVIRLRKMSEAGSNQTNASGLDPGKAEAAAREARFQAEIAQEEEDYRDAIGSLSAKLYQNSRPVVMGTLFGQLASATEAAGKVNTNETQTLSSTLAKQGWALVQLVGAAEPLADGSPDWATARTQLSIWRTNQPLELRAFLSLAFFSVGQLDVALTEFETIDVSSVTNANDLMFCRVGRTLLYTQQGWNHLAAQEAALLSESKDEGAANEAGRFMIAGLHAFLAYDAGKKREFAKLDSEIAQGRYR